MQLPSLLAVLTALGLAVTASPMRSSSNVAREPGTPVEVHAALYTGTGGSGTNYVQDQVEGEDTTPVEARAATVYSGNGISGVNYVQDQIDDKDTTPMEARAASYTLAATGDKVQNKDE